MWADPLAWFPWIKIAAFIVGMFVGSFAVSSTSWVWWKRQVLTVAACWLATLGTGMIGMSIWQSIKIEGAGFSARLGDIEAQLKDTQNELKRTAITANAATEAIRTQTSQISEQANTVEYWTKALKDIKSEGTIVIDPTGATLASEGVLLVNQKDAVKALTDKGYGAKEAQTIIDTIKMPPSQQSPASPPSQQ
jgi:uncharacterized membrane protein YcjF (UPF0283 family)